MVPSSNGHMVQHPAVPEADLSTRVWFDGWSDGPFTLAEVEDMIRHHPPAALELHVFRRPELSYAQLYPGGRPTAVT